MWHCAMQKRVMKNTQMNKYIFIQHTLFSIFTFLTQMSITVNMTAAVSVDHSLQPNLSYAQHFLLPNTAGSKE